VKSSHELPRPPGSGARSAPIDAAVPMACSSAKLLGLRKQVGATEIAIRWLDESR